MTDPIDQIFAAAREDKQSRPSDALMARVLADAYALQPAVVVMPPDPLPGWRGTLAAAIAALGGFRVVSGLGTVAVVGLFIGYADLPSADWLAQGLSLTDSADVDLLFADDLFLTEG